MAVAVVIYVGIVGGRAGVMANCLAISVYIVAHGFTCLAGKGVVVNQGTAGIIFLWASGGVAHLLKSDQVAKDGVWE